MKKTDPKKRKAWEKSPREQIWARRKGEPPSAHRYAFAYFQAGAKRSIDKIEEYLKPQSAGNAAEQKVGKRSAKTRQFFRLSTKWQWVKRAAAYDVWMDAKNMEADALFGEQESKKWTQRARDRRETMYQIAEQERAAADMMNQYPLVEVKRVVEKDADGRETQIQIIKPVGWAKRDVSRF